jgi:hypothetical protein
LIPLVIFINSSLTFAVTEYMNARCRASDNCSKDKCKRNLVDVNNIEAVHHELLWFHEQGYYRLKETYHQYVLDQCGNRGGGRTARGSRQSNSSTTAANSANSSAGIVLDSSSSSAAPGNSSSSAAPGSSSAAPGSSSSSAAPSTVNGRRVPIDKRCNFSKAAKDKKKNIMKSNRQKKVRDVGTAIAMQEKKKTALKLKKTQQRTTTATTAALSV